jgi:hypothetical protein
MVPFLRKILVFVVQRVQLRLVFTANGSFSTLSRYMISLRFWVLLSAVAFPNHFECAAFQDKGMRFAGRFDEIPQHAKSLDVVILDRLRTDTCRTTCES